MSYDVYLVGEPRADKCVCRACDNEHAVTAEPTIYSVNYTSNMSGAWDAAGAPIRDWSGRTVAKVLPAFAAAIDRIERHPEAYRHCEPSNGWGTVERMLDLFIKPLYRVMVENPRAKIRVSL